MMPMLCTFAALMTMGISGTQQPNSASSGTPSAPLISMKLKNARLSDVVEVLGKQYKLRIVADEFYSAPVLANVSIENVPLPTLLEQVSQQFQRDVLFQGGFIVFRHTHWFLAPQADEDYVKSYSPPKRPGGTVVVERVETAAATTGQPSGSGTAPAKAQAYKPVRQIFIAVRDAKCDEVFKSISKATGWQVSTEFRDSRLGKRHISAYAQRATPGELLDAVTLLLGASQRVTIGLTEEQRKAEAEMTAAANDSRSEREKESDELFRSLMNEATPEERDQFARTGELTMSMGRLSPGTRKQAEKYVTNSFDRTSQRVPELGTLDLGRMGEVQLRISRSDSAISVYGFNTAGGRIGF